ncbi:hypothetical protein FRC09_006876 [Ceratobasidium sp. 395]|nr:hypothetical protein FRC09_006876 [Ceratobasidium sp. 395]
MPRISADKYSASSRKDAIARPKGLAKRVQYGARCAITREQWDVLVQAFVDCGGLPKRKDLQELADEMDRCPKQLSVWFSNRRQNLRDARVKEGIVFKSVEETYDFLWAKYRIPKSEKEESSDSASPSAWTPSDSCSDLTRASSSEVSECSEIEASASVEEDDVQVAPRVGAPGLDILIQAFKWVAEQEKVDQEVCDALACLRCA